MTANHDDNWHPRRVLGRPIHALSALAETLVSRAKPSRGADEQADPFSGARDRGGSTANRRIGHGTEHLVTPGERILQLLEGNGGRMKQGEIVRAVEWSESTVSRKLGTLETAGSITRYRIGRGKIVFHPDAEPECVGSPFDREDEERPLAA